MVQILIIGTSCTQEHRKEKGEEDGTQLKITQSYNELRYGVRLILKYDQDKEAFIGTVENKSKKIAERTRVEVHLSNGTELGPTKPKNLKPGEKIQVKLSAKGQKFNTWSTHAEVGSREHEGEVGDGHESRERGEHSNKVEKRRGEHVGEAREGRGEHGREVREGRNEHGGEDRGEHDEGTGHKEGGEGYSDGAESRDMNRSPITSINDSYEGEILGLKVDITYNKEKKALIGTVKNVSSKTIKFIQNEPHLLMGKKTVSELGPQRLGDLKPGETTKTVIYLEKDPKYKGGNFDGYFVHIEVGEDGYPTHESGEKEGHEEGGEHSRKEGKVEHKKGRG